MSSSSADGSYELYNYNPSVAAAVIFVLLFLAITVHHVYQLARAHAWYFTCFVLGGILEVIGYIARASAHNNTSSQTIFTLQTLLILLAPPLYAATLYMTLGRLVFYLDKESLSIVPTRWLTVIFVAGDIISFLIQGAGGAILTHTSTDASALTTGQNIIIAGLVIQLLFFTVFLLAAITFHYRIHRSPSSQSISSCIATDGWFHATWETTLLGLYVAGALILVRSVYRLAEYASAGATGEGYLGRHEAFAYVFDALPMFLGMVVMAVWHPSRVLLLNRRVYQLDMAFNEERNDVQLSKIYLG
ncbi:RTA1 domain-containing protein [Aspergillus homomorphus CBS 101889]|uniref:RTA1 domain protein n=1 Tax=Aspergillus homomorphus (strain CBS 101889) TaxID=1450537 RepID=A0A395HM81_ASPHC|nr:RTA1 domain protein [Aspergillus homomorphus CBS 101889]RAL08726.1 RTA1 domain protein [Aspergillus homomorphus CBS 101889]